MKPLRILAFLLFYGFITFLWLLYDRRNVLDKHTVTEILGLPAIWVFPIIMIIVGLILGRLYSYFKKTSTKYFIIGQLSCIALTFLLFGYTYISDVHHEKLVGNFEYNRATREYTFYPDDSPYQRKAFDALEGNFSDKNSFRITDLISDDKDTIVNSMPIKLYVAWFEYYKSADTKKRLCAKYYVFNDTTINVYRDEDVTKNFDFTKRKALKDSLLRAVDSLDN
jgi:hypothetical protein